MDNNKANVLLEDLHHFIRFYFTEKVILKGDSYVIDKEVYDFFNIDVLINKEVIDEVKRKLLKQEKEELSLYELTTVDGKEVYKVSKEKRLEGLKGLVESYNTFIKDNDEVELIEYFYNILLRKEISNFYLNLKNVSMSDIILNNEDIFDSIRLYVGVVKKHLECELLDETRVPLGEGDVKMLGSVISTFLGLFLFRKLTPTKSDINVIKILLATSNRRRLLKKLDKEFPFEIGYLTYDLDIYNTLFLFIKKHKKSFQKEELDSIIELYVYLKEPNHEYYTDKEIISIKKILDRYKKFFDTFDIKGKNSIVNEQKYKKILEEVSNLEKIGKKIKSKVIGQDSVIDTIVKDYLGKLLLGFNKRPISFLFMGESGTGKTELGKSIAEALGTKSLFIPLGNYNDRHTAQTILGAPPSYVGYGAPTIIEKYLEELKELGTDKKPVIIFDEVEKAIPDIQNIFLELLDEGKISLLSGTTLTINNAVIIFTSNLGVKARSIGFDIDMNEDEKKKIAQDTMLEAAKKFFLPEVFNRMGEVFFFKKLPKQVVKQILKQKIKVKLEELSENPVIQYLDFNKKEIELNAIYKELEKDIDFEDISNVRKIEGEIETLITNKILTYVKK